MTLASSTASAPSAAGARRCTWARPSLRVMALCGMALLLIGQSASGQEADAKDATQLFVELTCEAGGIAKLRTLSPAQIEPAWRDPKIGPRDRISPTRNIMRVRDPHPKDATVSTQGSRAHRTASCLTAGKTVAVRVTEYQQPYGYDEEVFGYLRLWIDRRPTNMDIVSLQNLNAAVDARALALKACVDHTPVDNPNDADELVPKTRCESSHIKLGAIDGVEFATSALVQGPNQDLVLIEAADPKLCKAIGPHLDGAPFPAGFEEPTPVKAPETWEQANAAKTYRIDGDNDGEIDDVAVLEVDQHIYQGSVLAIFQKDSVLTGAIEPPWWADLMSVGLNESAHTSKPLPKEFKSAATANELGGSGSGFIELFVHRGQTYARVNDWYGSHHHEEYLVEAPEVPPVLAESRMLFFEQHIMRLKPTLEADRVCRFQARTEFIP